MKTLDMKNDMIFFLYAALLCLFWYFIFILTDQAFAAIFSAICVLLALYNLSWFVFDMICFVKNKHISAPYKENYPSTQLY
jgi:hypothetical protein